MANLADTDYLVVNRANADYKISGADLKGSLGPQGIKPAPSDFTFVPPVVSGTGTIGDPFVLTPATVSAPGGTVNAAQVMSLTGLKPNNLAQWSDDSTGAGARFTQDLTVVPTSGNIDLRLKYIDKPNSTVGAVFNGLLHIGTTYFKWEVTQQVSSLPVVGTVVASDVPGGDRFTSTAFPVTVTMTDEGIPASTKGLKAWVEGTLKVRANSDEIVGTAAVTIPGGWTGGVGAADNNWHAVTYGNGKFVAVAQNGANRVMYSPDGINWTAASATEASSWYSITYGNGKFVAVSYDGTNPVMYSADGISWTAATAAAPNSWWAVTYGNGKFVAVSNDGVNRVMWSTNGINWTAALAAEASSWRSITYGNDKFVAVSSNGANRVMWSTNGINWTTASAATDEWWGVTYGNGKFVAVADAGGTKHVMWSSTGNDPYAATALTLASNKDLTDFAAGDAVKQDSTVSGTGTQGTGDVVSVDPAVPSITVKNVTSVWTPSAGKFVVGPEKTKANAKLYTVHDAAGAVSDLQSADPGYVTMTGSSPYALTFPATLPTGNAPDIDIPAPATLTVDVKASNSGGSSNKTSTITPA